MKAKYTQLTAEERYHIYTMTKQAISLRQIGNGMGRSHRCLSREIKRNKGENGYRYKQAQRKALARHKTKPKAIKLTEPRFLS
jgi:IS30 family transposase